MRPDGVLASNANDEDPHVMSALNAGVQRAASGVPVLAAANPGLDQGPCTVCGKPWREHGTAPVYESHNYTPASGVTPCGDLSDERFCELWEQARDGMPDGRCGHVQVRQFGKLLLAELGIKSHGPWPLGWVPRGVPEALHHTVDRETPSGEQAP